MIKCSKILPFELVILPRLFKHRGDSQKAQKIKSDGKDDDDDDEAQNLTGSFVKLCQSSKNCSFLSSNGTVKELVESEEMDAKVGFPAMQDLWGFIYIFKFLWFWIVYKGAWGLWIDL